MRTHIDLDDGVDGGGVDEAEVGEVAPRNVLEVLDGAEGDDLARRVRLGVGRLVWGEEKLLSEDEEEEDLLEISPEILVVVETEALTRISPQPSLC